MQGTKEQPSGGMGFLEAAKLLVGTIAFSAVTTVVVSAIVRAAARSLALAL